MILLSLVWLALLPVVIWCFRTEWAGMYQSVLHSLRLERIYPEPEEDPGMLP